MKGTLFSADFIEDLNGDLRLLEINTDTSVTNLTQFDYTDFIALLQSNNITKLTVIHKPLLHQEIVNSLKSAINENATFITEFVEQKVSTNVIFPPTVEDDTDHFVLRLAYDETSIFDSEYAKGKLNLLSLFYDAGESGSVSEFYHSSSVYGVYDSITKDGVNNLNFPDAVAKDITESHKMAKFYKIGSESENETAENKWNNFISQIDNENMVIEKYHINTGSLVDDTVSSIRVYSIVYGSNLDLVNIAYYKKYAIFSLPTGSIHDETKYVNELDNKHYYEFATNYLKYEGQSHGLLNTHLIIKSDDTEVEAGNLVVGDILKSFHVDGTIMDENVTDLNEWQLSGSVLPTGSYMTSSVLIYKVSKPLDNKTLIKLTVNGNEDSLYVSPVKSFLVHDSDDDYIKWKMAIDVNENTDFLLDYDTSTAQVTSNEFFIANEEDFSLVEFDVEDSDTYIIAGSTPIQSFITHNDPCFVAGTLVTLSDGSMKKIEDVVAGDVVSTFDLESETIKHNVVNAVLSKNVTNIVEYKFDNGEVLKCTFDHPIFVENKGWCSFDSELSNQSYSLEKLINKIETGDVVKLFNGKTSIVEITTHDGDTIVYNLQDIENNHNFFANNILVHNRFCFITGTQITMADGTFKNIEDVVVGDEVISLNEETKLNEVKKVVDTKSPIHNDLVKYTLSNGVEITSTIDHPFYVNKMELASYAPKLTNERYQLDVHVRKIEKSDCVYMIPKDGGLGMHAVAISKMEAQPLVDTQTYIFTVEDNHNFYANGILVHNK